MLAHVLLREIGGAAADQTRLDLFDKPDEEEEAEEEKRSTADHRHDGVGDLAGRRRSVVAAPAPTPGAYSTSDGSGAVSD